jgi:hypothetical protein
MSMFIRNIVSVLCALCCAVSVSYAQEPEPVPVEMPPAQPAKVRQAAQMLSAESEALRDASFGREIPREPQQTPDATARGFGYTLVTGLPDSWVNLTAPVNLNLVGDDVILATAIGFPFKFYENTYTSTQVSSNGYLSFNPGNPAYLFNQPVPAADHTNNAIFALWDDLIVGVEGNTGAVLKQTFGSTPNRFTVFEWRDVGRWGEPVTATYKFQVVLYESGQIDMNFCSCLGRLSHTTGIENSRGTDGMQYWFRDNESTEFPVPGFIRFVRPPAAPRVESAPAFSGQFVQAGDTVVFPFTVVNTGELGPDAFDVALSSGSGWPLSVTRADGVTPLSDTNGNGVPDTGPLSMGAAQNLQVAVRVPTGAAAGDYALVLADIRSRVYPQATNTAVMQLALPMSFAQLIADARGDTGLTLDVFRAGGLQRNILQANTLQPFNASLSSRGSRELQSMWVEGRCANDQCTRYIEDVYTMVHNGCAQPVSDRIRVSNQTASPVSMYSYSMDAAAASDGRTGLVWVSRAETAAGTAPARNANVVFQQMSAALSPGPTISLTNFALTPPGAVGDVLIWNARVAVTGDNRFFVSWNIERFDVNGIRRDVFYAVLSADGQILKPPAQLTADTVDDADSNWLSVPVAVSGNRVALVYQGVVNGSSDIYVQLFDASANPLGAPVNVVNDPARWDFTPDADVLADGRIIIGWTAEQYTSVDNGFLWVPRYAVATVGQSSVSAGPANLINTPVTGKVWDVRVTRGDAGTGVITWGGADLSNARAAFYAAIDTTSATTPLRTPALMQSPTIDAPLFSRTYAAVAALPARAGCFAMVPSVANRPLYTGSFETEPNDRFDGATGPLVSGQTYSGSQSDERDYFSVYLERAGTLSIVVTGADPVTQLQLFFNSPASGNLLTGSPNNMNVTYSASQRGWYYVYLNNGARPSGRVYTLRVTY